MPEVKPLHKPRRVVTWCSVPMMPRCRGNHHQLCLWRHGWHSALAYKCPPHKSIRGRFFNDSLVSFPQVKMTLSYLPLCHAVRPGHRVLRFGLNSALYILLFAKQRGDRFICKTLFITGPSRAFLSHLRSGNDALLQIVSFSPVVTPCYVIIRLALLP